MLVLQQIKKIKTSTQVNHGIIAKENNNNKKIHQHHILESHAKYYHKERKQTLITYTQNENEQKKSYLSS